MCACWHTYTCGPLKSPFHIIRVIILIVNPLWELVGLRKWCNMVRPLAELRGNHHHSVIISDVKNVSVLERDLQDLIVHGQLFPTKVLGTKKKS